MKREVVYVAAMVLVGFALDRLFWFLPILVLLPGIIAYTVASPLWYLALIATGAELLSVLPAGIVAAVVLTPWLAKHLARNITVDVSFSYLLVVVLTVVGQLFILFLPDSVAVLRQWSWSGAGLSEVVAMVPWLKMAVVSVLASLFVYGTTVLVHFNRTW